MYGIVIAQSAIQTDKTGLPRFAGIIPGTGLFHERILKV